MILTGVAASQIPNDSDPCGGPRGPEDSGHKVQHRSVGDRQRQALSHSRADHKVVDLLPREEWPLRRWSAVLVIWMRGPATQ